MDWDGTLNARDLGGLQANGGRIRCGAVVRADHPANMPATGWEQLRAHGVRTIIDLTGLEESQTDLAARLPS
ncbi:hypothetical protein GCM10009854_26460 [Saccharopolyspora halophila]|uniref:Phosphatase n=1 Tax=Saccharopolyspora halophila TaxID=405551 RepID=A0ABN3GBI6_9PSEU